MRLLLRSAIAIALLYPMWGSAGVIRLEPSNQEAVVGSTVVLDIIAADMNIAGFNLTLSFDPLLLEPTALEFGPFLGGGFPFSFQESSIGFDSLNVAELSLLDSSELIELQQGEFRLARLDFTALMPGVTEVGFSSAEATDPDAVLLSPELGFATVTIEEQSNGTVPEPGGALLCVAGLLAIGSRAIRHRQRLMAGGIGRRSTDK